MVSLGQTKRDLSKRAITHSNSHTQVWLWKSRCTYLCILLTVQVIVRIGHHQLLQTKSSFPIAIEMTNKGSVTDTALNMPSFINHHLYPINLNNAKGMFHFFEHISHFHCKNFQNGWFIYRMISKGTQSRQLVKVRLVVRWTFSL